MGKKEGTFWIDEENNELILKVDEEEERFVIEEELKIDGEKYLILASTENENDEAIAFKLIEDEETLSVIEDDDEFERVREKYMST